MFGKDAEVNPTTVCKKLNEIVAARGKKRTDRLMQLELLRELYFISESNNLGVAVAAKLKSAIVSAFFDYNKKITDPMKPDHWNR